LLYGAKYRFDIVIMAKRDTIPQIIKDNCEELGSHVAMRMKDLESAQGRKTIA